MADPRDADTIRDELLLAVRGEHDALGERIVTAPKSFYYVLGTALAVELEGAEFEAASARQEAFPDTASEAGVLKHAEFLGVVRLVATQAVERIRILGTPSTTLTVAAGKTLTDAQGLVYLAAAGDVATDGAGFGFLAVTARDPGAEQNLPLGATLTWQNGAPSGMAATAITAVASGDPTHALVVGADAETIEDLRTRVIAAFKEPAKGAGARVDYVLNAEAVSGVGAAFGYMRAKAVRYENPGGDYWEWTYNTPGRLVILALGAAPPANSYVQDNGGSLGLGLQPTFTRILSSTVLGRIRGYIEGTTDTAGRAVPESAQVQRRPGGMALGNYVVDSPIPGVVDVTVLLTVDPGIARWPWGITDGTSRTIQASPAPTTTTFTLDEVTGIANGSRIAVFVGTSVIKGGWWLSTVASIVGNAVTIATAAPSAPSGGAQKVRPDCGLWSETRRLVLALIDSLGPGDIPLNVEPEELGSQRYPRPNDRGSDRLFKSDIIAELEGLTGVLGVTVEAPAFDVTSLPGKLAIPGVITVKIG